MMYPAPTEPWDVCSGRGERLCNDGLMHPCQICHGSGMRS